MKVLEALEGGRLHGVGQRRTNNPRRPSVAEYESLCFELKFMIAHSAPQRVRVVLGREAEGALGGSPQRAMCWRR